MLLVTLAAYEVPPPPDVVVCIYPICVDVGAVIVVVGNDAEPEPDEPAGPCIPCNPCDPCNPCNP